ncbi:TonB-dependent receptor domain-containing protein [Pseudoduganella violaceinigra]|uniref:TonB-dependent receptor domain-containing protein n=1 Tax=Pseudoduganella violaceinigra TaxID=246602 RepID=UPI0003FD4503|nr:TonB-dependent receptor [Pseudoduganella violaceinigra]
MTIQYRYSPYAAGPLLILLCCGNAAAQSPASQPEKNVAAPAAVKKESSPEPGAITSVTVAAERPTNRIDRQVYDVKSDASTSNSSAADALNNVPSVNVDPDGSLTLRGSSNVQIYVDGKPSAMLQGDNRGPALQAIPADDLESVEVINNPGAQFGNEGGGGPIINLVMKRSRRPGGFGVANANYGTAGRYNSALSGSYNEGLWGFQGGINVRHDGRNSVGDTVRDRIDPRSGSLSHSDQHAQSSGLNDNAALNGGVTYNLGANDTVGAQVAYSQRTNDGHATDRYVSTDAGGIVTDDYLRSTVREGESKNYSWTARWDHKGATPGDTFKMDLRVSNSTNDSDNAYRNSYVVRPPFGSQLDSAQQNHNKTEIIDFTGDYEANMFGGLTKLGYKIVQNRNDSSVDYTNIDPVTLEGSPNALRSNAFDMKETIYAAYGSYQMRLNEQWGMQAGLRAERTEMEIDQLTSQTVAGNSYTNLIPSFFVTYKIDDTSTLRFAYAHRLRRPNAQDLNPFVVYRDELNVSSGNPKLKPAQTDSFELGYETRLFGLETNLRGYFRDETDSILDRKYFIGNNVLLTTRENAGSTRSGGMEFTLTGKLLPTLTLNLSGNAARFEQNVLEANGDQSKRTASSLSGRLRLNWQATASDMLQAAVQAQGKMLTGQGYREPNTTLNLTWRHAITPQLAFVLNATDVFNSNRISTITDTYALREQSLRRFDGRIVYLGLSYRFGGVNGVRREGGPEHGPGGMRGHGGPGMGPPPGMGPGGD